MFLEIVLKFMGLLFVRIGIEWKQKATLCHRLDADAFLKQFQGKANKIFGSFSEYTALYNLYCIVEIAESAEKHSEFSLLSFWMDQRLELGILDEKAYIFFLNAKKFIQQVRLVPSRIRGNRCKEISCYKYTDFLSFQFSEKSDSLEFYP